MSDKITDEIRAVVREEVAKCVGSPASEQIRMSKHVQPTTIAVDACVRDIMVVCGWPRRSDDAQLVAAIIRKHTKPVVVTGEMVYEAWWKGIPHHTCWASLDTSIRRVFDETAASLTAALARGE